MDQIGSFPVAALDPSFASFGLGLSFASFYDLYKNKQKQHIRKSHL
jgi:hypothetical protein